MLRESTLRARRSASRLASSSTRAHHLGHVVAHIFLGLLHEQLGGLGCGQAGDALQCGQLLRLRGPQLLGEPRVLGFALD